MWQFERLSREIVRALRGRRSQAGFSRLLGYRSNVVFDWEAGRRFPTAAVLLRLALRVGVDLRRNLTDFLRPAPHWLKLADFGSPEGVVLLLKELRGKAGVSELALGMGCSRYAVSRWLSGRTEPRFPDFLRLIDKSSLRLLDFLACLVDVGQLPSAAPQWHKLNLARNLAYDEPWSQAVLRALELDEYAGKRRHVPGFIAKRLGISPAEEERCLSLLKASGQVEEVSGKYRVCEQRVVDTRRDPERSRKLRAFWAGVSTERLLSGVDGEFAFNLFGVSRSDFARIRELQRAYFRELRSIVAASNPTECVALVQTHLIALTNAPSSHGGAPGMPGRPNEQACVRRPG